MGSSGFRFSSLISISKLTVKESMDLAENLSRNRFRKARAVSAVSSSSARRRAASGFVSAHSAVSSVSSGLMHSRSVAGGTAPFIRCGVSSYSTSWLRICYRSQVSQLGR